MKSIFKVSFIFILILMINCRRMDKNNEHVAPVDTHEFVKSDLCLELPLDDKTSYYTFSMFVYHDPSGIDYLSMENRQTNEINIFRLDSCKLFRKIPVHQAGPNAVLDLMGHKLLSLNNILVNSLNMNMLARIDSTGTVLQRIRITDSSGDNRPLIPLPPISRVYMPMVVDRNHIYLLSSLPNHYYEISGSDFKTFPICIDVDTLKEIVTCLPLGYPELWSKTKRNGEFLRTDFCREYDGKCFIYSFAIMDDIIVTEDHKTSLNYSLKSRYMTPSKGLQELSIDGSYRQNSEEPRYANLLYDQYRDVYYRFVYLPYELKEGDDPKIVSKTHKGFSVIIADSSFNVIGETQFPEDTYVPDMSFVTKEGLYISENNYKNINLDEDKLVFRLFTLEKK